MLAVYARPGDKYDIRCLTCGLLYAAARNDAEAYHLANTHPCPICD